MFLKSDLRKYRIFQGIREPNFNSRSQQYVFLEDDSDVRALDERSYEHEIEEVSYRQVVKYIVPRATHHFEINYFQIINELLHVSVGITFFETTEDLFFNVDIGDHDIALLATVGVPSSHSFLPTYESSALMWVNNLDYERSSLYFAKVFSWQLWAFFLMTFVLLCFFVWIMIRIYQYWGRQIKDASSYTYNLLSMLVSQGNDDIQNSPAAYKIALIVFSLLVIIFYGAFNSFLTTQFSLKNTNYPFHDLDGALQNKDYTLCSAVIFDLESLLVPYTRGKYNTSAKINHPDRCPKQMKTINGDINTLNANFKCDFKKIVIFGGINVPDQFPHCKLTKLNGKYFRDYRTVATYSGFRYKQQFNIKILRIKSAGVMDRLIRKFEFVQSTVEDQEEIIPIEFDHISLILRMYMVAVFISTAAYLCEIAVGKIKSSQFQNRIAA